MALTDENMQKYLISETDFSLSLLKELAGNTSLIFSPLSISLALSLVYSGAKGNTKEQIKNVILKGATESDVIDFFSTLQSSFLNAIDGVTVNLANKAFFRSGFDINPDYISLLKKHFNAEAESLDFNQKEKTVEIVNSFVSHVTNGKISKILQSSSINSDTIGILVNALYMKADWMKAFKEHETHKRKFFANQNSGREIDFLNERNGKRLMAENDLVTVLSLKYKDPSFSFNIFLPKERFGLSKVLKELSSENIQNLLSGLREEVVNVHIPKMKLESQMGLRNILAKIGIDEMFSMNADLSGIASGIYVSDVVHKALIEVDEKGTVAAAATAVTIQLLCAVISPEEPLEFLADHPFLFTLNNNNNIVDEKGTVAAAATAVIMTRKSATISLVEPKEFLADHPFLFTLNKDNHIVDEKGTVAAAATVVQMRMKCAMIYTTKPKEFIADHPFLFSLNHNNHIVFIGIHH